MLKIICIVNIFLIPIIVLKCIVFILDVILQDIYKHL